MCNMYNDGEIVGKVSDFHQEEVAEEVSEKEIEESVDTEEAKVEEHEEESTFNIPRVAVFEKVSLEEFTRTFKPMCIENLKQMAIANGEEVDGGFAYKEEEVQEIINSVYNNIKLPVRATVGSAGYDFFYPFGHTELPPGCSVEIPTGIKAAICPGWVLMEFPRSSLGFNYKLVLDNTVGIIDSDYYDNEGNEGHIKIKVTNDNREGKTIILEQGDKFCQGIFLPFGITIDDNATGIRKGGIGHTGR